MDFVSVRVSVCIVCLCVCLCVCLSEGLCFALSNLASYFQASDQKFLETFLGFAKICKFEPLISLRFRKQIEAQPENGVADKKCGISLVDCQ